MLPEDQKRLEREVDIARAKRGPDYSMLEASIARNKAAANSAQQAQATANRTFDMAGARQKAMRESVYIPQLNVMNRRPRFN